MGILPMICFLPFLLLMFLQHNNNSHSEDTGRMPVLHMGKMPMLHPDMGKMPMLHVTRVLNQ
jgi:hypothetical protein